METRGTLFREIHKNTWLKRLTVDNKKVTVGSKKSERSWVVFCVHDDCEAILEGYVEPRQAASHAPEWTIPLQNALHISHALIPSEHEYEFVITLTSEVVRFNATSWEIMHEWVDTLRQKLREMKILSPKENLYSKLPEIRAPLLPTRDPTSPLPAPPPVPAALVPGIERIVTSSQTVVSTAFSLTTATTSANGQQRGQSDTTIATNASDTIQSAAAIVNNNNNNNNTATSTSVATAATTNIPPTTAMSNTLTQNLINMLSNPVSAYSHQLSNISSDTSSNSLEDSFFFEEDDEDITTASNNLSQLTSNVSGTTENRVTEPMPKVKKELFQRNDNLSSLARTFADNVLSDPNTCPVASTSGSARDREHLDDDSSGSTVIDPETSSIDSATSSVFQAEPLVIPRPHTNRSSARDANHQKRLAISTSSKSVPIITKPETVEESAAAGSTNITIIQVSSPMHANKVGKNGNATTKDIFNFSNPGTSHSKIEMADDNFKSNVQIIPSNFSPPALSTQTSNSLNTSNPSTVNTHYLPVKTKPSDSKVTTVQVSGATTSLAAGYGKIIKSSLNSINNLEKVNGNNVQTSISSSTLTNANPSDTAVRNFGSITNIPIGSESEQTNVATNTTTQVQLHYEQVFVTPSSSLVPIINSSQTDNQRKTVTSTPLKQASLTELHINRINLQKDNKHKNKENNGTSDLGASSSTVFTTGGTNSTVQSTVAVSSAPPDQPSTSSNATVGGSTQQVQLRNTNNNNNNISTGGKMIATMRENLPSPLPAIRKLLTRGLTEVSISRPSRRDANAQTERGRNKNMNINNSESPAESSPPQHETREHRRRSSSHSDAQAVRSRTTATVTTATSNNNNPSTNEVPRRMQPAPQPFRPGDKSSGVGSSSRLTLREQQVQQLRKEIMSPGGVRIQLRRKDCVGSIALVDAFGAVWISGWKQKDYPMLYNALHIGDQLVSIAGVNVNCAADANKIIRNITSLYTELIIRRTPFGRVYAIRREMDGQCLGLIRDGNTATIVDVVPKSLSARHGLPPKAQSCDGLSLTFWVLTEINGRPLNLFFKENEVKDRLNSIGRDISILVQPSDLIAKLKKQLKSLRSYKDYIVQ